MPVRVYYIHKQLITGTEESPQTILYDGLTDYITDEALDATLTGIESVDIPNTYQQRRAKIIEGSITTTQFQVALLDIGNFPLTSGYVDIRIVVEE